MIRRIGKPRRRATLLNEERLEKMRAARAKDRQQKRQPRKRPS